MSPEIDPNTLLHVTDRRAWRAWLKVHYKAKTEVWLVSYKKHTGKPQILYNDAVEEALCFGWIDSTRKTLDQDRYAQRFSVRRSKSGYSQANVERLRNLIAQGKVMPEVLAALGDLGDEDAFEVPSDIQAALQANPQAWQHFQSFSPAYIRIRIAFIEAARKRPTEFHKRLHYFIRMTEQNKQIGYGGIEKHY